MNYTAVYRVRHLTSFKILVAVVPSVIRVLIKFPFKAAVRAGALEEGDATMTTSGIF